MNADKHVHTSNACLITYNEQDGIVTKILDLGVGQTGI